MPGGEAGGIPSTGVDCVTTRMDMTMQTQSRLRLGIVAALAASALTGGVMIAPANAADSTDYTVYSTGGTNAAANVAPALPAGLSWTKVSAGTTQTLYLRSDGQVFGTGANTNHSLDIPALPAGVTYVDVDGTGDVTVLVRSDGQIVYASNPYAKPLYVPALPTGVTYKKVFSGGTSITALRSDGRAVMFKVYFDDRYVDPTPAPTADPTATPSPTPTATATPVVNPAAVYTERVTADADYIDAATSGSDYALLLHATGKAKFVDLRVTKTPALGTAKVPTLPAGMRYTAIDAASVAVYVRSDGKVITAGATPKGTISIPATPVGVTYVDADAGDYSVSLLLSNGNSAVVGYSDTIGVTPTVPKIAKGYKFSAISNNASHATFVVSKLLAGQTVQTSISSVKRPTIVVHGTSATYTVKVFSMAATRGGQIKITYKNKVIGTGVIGDGAKATIQVSTALMPKKARNKVGIAFMGIGNAGKSTSATKYVGYIRTK